MNRKYIIIVSSGRTGTTALSNILAKSNKSVAYLPELKFFYLGLSNRKTIQTGEIYKRAILKFLKFNKKYNSVINIKESIKRFKEKSQSIKNISNFKQYEYILTFLIDEILEHKKYEYYILQTPANLFLLDLISKTINKNNIHIIYMIRDSRSFVSSAYFKGWSNNILQLICLWNYANNVLHKTSKKHSGLLIKQEDLLLDEKSILKEVLIYLNLPQHLNHVKDNVLKNSSFSTQNRLETLNQYAKYLSKKEIKLIEYFTAKNLRRYNYKIEYDVTTYGIKYKIKFLYQWIYLKNKIIRFFNAYGLSDIRYKLLSRFLKL